MYDALVIGGGVSGLTAAYEIGKKGKRCLVVEKENIGGVIKTAQVDGYQCELGPNVFLNKRGFSDFLTEIGLADDMVPPNTNKIGRYVWCKDRVCPAPTSLIEFLKTPLFPDYDKLLCARLPLALFSNRILKPQAEDENLAVFLGRIFGRRTLERLIDPILKGVIGGDVDSLSARSVFPKLWECVNNGGTLRDYLKGREKRGGIFVMRSGASCITTRLTTKAQELGVEFIKLGVEELKRGQERFDARLQDGSTVSARTVFIATSGVSTANYLNITPDASRELKTLNYADIVVIHCETEEHIAKGGYGILFPKGLPSKIMGVMYNTELFPYKGPKQLLTLCFGGVSEIEYLKTSEEELASSALSELQEKLHVKARLLNVHKVPYAIPQYEMGHYKLIQALDNLEKECPGLYFIGAERGGVAVPDRIATVREIVRQVS